MRTLLQTSSFLLILIFFFYLSLVHRVDFESSSRKNPSYVLSKDFLKNNSKEFPKYILPSLLLSPLSPIPTTVTASASPTITTTTTTTSDKYKIPSKHQIMLVTTWRSGSTFLGDIFVSLPGTFYHYEPLLMTGIKQIRRDDPDLVKEALALLNSLWNCDYSSLDKYIEYGLKKRELHIHNKVLYDPCVSNYTDCITKSYLHNLCSHSSVSVMKTVRLRLELTSFFLINRSYSHIIYLVRDPRGTLQSRKHREWCPGVNDCSNPSVLCSDLVSDYKAARQLKKLYPKRFSVIRYEDFSIDVYNQTKKLFSNLHLPYDKHVETFLDNHTRVNTGAVWDTTRNSKLAPFHWIQDLSYKEINNIQSSCFKAMKLWGYRKLSSSEPRNTFKPVDHSWNLD